MMKKSLVKLLPAASALALVVGCAAERDVAYEIEGMQELEPSDPAFQGTPGYDATPANLDLSDAELRGRMGEVGVDDSAWVDGYADGTYASVYSNVDEARNGAVMTIFDIEGGLFHDELAPGTQQTFRPEEIYDAPEGAAFVTVATVALVYWSSVWASAGQASGLTALRIAVGKTQLGFGEAFARGVLCNALVCLAVWLCQSGRSTTDKVLAIVWPITAFVALGFEHSIANMYFIPLGIVLRTNDELATAAAGQGVGLDSLDMAGFASNLVPVTLGNIVGGTLLVAGIYWFVYLRGTESDAG